jgi:hypothetical protein
VNRREFIALLGAGFIGARLNTKMHLDGLVQKTSSLS